MMPPKGKSTNTLQRAGEEDVRPGDFGGGGGGGYSDTFIYTTVWAILGVLVLNFNIFLGFRKIYLYIYFFFFWGGGGV